MEQLSEIDKLRIGVVVAYQHSNGLLKYAERCLDALSIHPKYQSLQLDTGRIREENSFDMVMDTSDTRCLDALLIFLNGCALYWNNGGAIVGRGLNTRTDGAKKKGVVEMTQYLNNLIFLHDAKKETLGRTDGR